MEEVMELLSDTQWDDSVDTLRPIRNKICELAGVPAPTITQEDSRLASASPSPYFLMFLLPHFTAFIPLVILISNHCNIASLQEV